MALLSGCTVPCATDCQTFVALGSDRAAITNPALAAMAEAFVRGDRRSRPAAGGGFLLIDPDVLKPGSETPRRLVRDRSVALVHERAVPLGQDLAAYGSLTAGLGQTRHRLPEGMGVLTDPARIGLTSLTLQPEAGLQRRWQGPGSDLTVAAGLGIQASLTETTVSSALLDVRHRSSHVMPYAALRFEVQPRQAPLSLALEARVARDGMSQLRADLRFPLGD